MSSGPVLPHVSVEQRVVSVTQETPHLIEKEEEELSKGFFFY